MLLGAIIEGVSGLTYEEYIRRFILQPLRMNRTDLLYTKTMEGDEAAGAHPLLNVMTPVLPFFGWSFIRELGGRNLWMERIYTDQTPSTGLIGSVSDAANLAVAYLNGGVFKGQRILSEESVRCMAKEGHLPSHKGDSVHYHQQGICWQNYANSDRWVITHEGGGPGFSTKIQLFPDEKFGIVLFTNDAMCEPWRIINLVGTLKW